MYLHSSKCGAVSSYKFMISRHHCRNTISLKVLPHFWRSCLFNQLLEAEFSTFLTSKTRVLNTCWIVPLNQTCTLPETNGSPLKNKPPGKRRFLLETSIFRGENVSFRVPGLPCSFLSELKNCKASANDQEPLNLLRVPRTRFGGGTSWLFLNKGRHFKRRIICYHDAIYSLGINMYTPMNPYTLQMSDQTTGYPKSIEWRWQTLPIFITFLPAKMTHQVSI